LEYTLNRCCDFVRKSAGSSIKTILTAHKGDLTVVGDLVQDAKINKKQKILLEGLGVQVEQLSDAEVALAFRCWDRLTEQQRQALAENGKNVVYTQEQQEILRKYDKCRA
jgi:hypothetical protein